MQFLVIIRGIKLGKKNVITFNIFIGFARTRQILSDLIYNDG